MTRDRLRLNPAVKLAESLGFVASDNNLRARRHFYWFLLDTDLGGDHGYHEFELHEDESGELSYRVRIVGDCGITSTSLKSTLSRLEKVYK